MNNNGNGRSLRRGSLVVPRVKFLIADANKHCNCREYCVKKLHRFSSRSFRFSSKNGSLIKFTVDESRKWDSRISNEKYCFYSILKLLEDQVSTISVASAELARAQTQIHDLQAESMILKKKVDHLRRKLWEERNSCRIREHDKLHSAVADLKNELKSERKNCRKMENFNCKLVDELLNAKAMVKELTEAYEKEKKARESVEEACNEMTNKITEEKVDFEVMKMETIRIQEQLEEERKMLQMAEVWREERVQMKLIDAKLALDDKYSELNKLATDMETFLRSKGSISDEMELQNAEMLKEAAKNVEEMEEFSYVPPKSSDIYSIVEEVKRMEAHKTKSLLRHYNDEKGLTKRSLSDSANTRFSEVDSKCAGQMKQKHSSASKLWKSSLRKIISSELQSSNTSSSVLTSAKQNLNSKLGL